MYVVSVCAGLHSFFLPSHFTAKSRIPLAVKYIEFDNSKKDFVEESVLFWVT